MKKYIAIIIYLTLTGCSSTLKTEQYKQITETTSYRYTPDNSGTDRDVNYYRTAYKSAFNKKTSDNCAELKDVRNGILFEQMRLIDNAYYDYESDTRKWVDGKKLFADIASIGISSAASIIGGAGIKSILALADTGLKGASSAYDGDYLQGKAIDMIINQMRASRAKAATTIMEGMKTCDYSIEQGIFDLGNYLRAGYLDSALVSLATSASKSADAEEDKLSKAQKCLNNPEECTTENSKKPENTK